VSDWSVPVECITTSAFAATTNGGRVRVAEIVHADRPGTIPNSDAGWSIVATVKGRRDNVYIGPFPSKTAAEAWCNTHLPIT